MNKFLYQLTRSLIQSFQGQLLFVDQSTIEYIVDLLSDLHISQDEKQETIQGILELNMNPSQQRYNFQGDREGNMSDSTKAEEVGLATQKTLEASVHDLIERAHSYLSNSTAHAEEEYESSSSSSSRASPAKSTSSSSSKKLSRLNQEEAEKKELVKKAILNQYGKVEIDESEFTRSEKKSKEITAKNHQDSSGDEVPKDLLDRELKLLDLKKRQRKKIESKRYTNSEDLLLRPNLNSKLVEHENKLKKQELSEKSKLKMQKDKADLFKQREAQEKKKMEARSKAKKLERKA